MNDQTEWPTSERLNELRSQGHVSYSQRSSACFIVAVLAAIALGAPGVPNAFSTLLRNLSGATSLDQLSETVRQAISLWVLIPAAVVAALTIVWGLLQTRFFFQLGRVSLNFSRLLPTFSASISSLSYRLATMIAAVMVSSIASFLLLKVVGIQVFSLLHDFSAPAVQRTLEISIHIFPIFILVGVVSAVLFLLFEKLRFARSHRMTRKEVLAEKQMQ